MTSLSSEIPEKSGLRKKSAKELSVPSYISPTNITNLNNFGFTGLSS